MIKKSIYILLFVFLSLSIKAQIAVIANKSVPVNQLTKQQLLDIYSGEIRSWNNGDPIFVFDLRTDLEIRDDFYQLIGRSSSRMKSIWMKKLLSGEGEPPKEIDSQDALILKIENSAGAIGFISSSKVTQKVKVIKIIE